MDDDEMQINDRDFITNERRWSGETLCLKKHPTSDDEKAGVMGYSAFGVIISDTAPFVIYLRGDDAAGDYRKTVQYETVDALLADGWIVD